MPQYGCLSTFVNVVRSNTIFVGTAATIRDMKKEQEAYNAKMNAKIHEQLNGWIALRENMATFSLQMKHIGTLITCYVEGAFSVPRHALTSLGTLELDQQAKKTQLKALVQEKTTLLASSER